MTSFAHRSHDGREQTLPAHLLGVSAKAREHAEKLQLGPAGALLGLLHDLGKGTAQFQQYLSSFGPESEIEPQDELRGKIDHSTAGAQVLVRELTAGRESALAAELANLLALPIVSHHSGLIDCVSPPGRDTLTRRLAKQDANTRQSEAWRTLDADVRARARALLDDPALLTALRRRVGRILHGPGSDGGEADDRHHLQLGLLVRMLFSCLIDADRTDTADFENPAAAQFRQHGRFDQWEKLLDRLDVALGALRADTGVNRTRHAISHACFHAASRPGGIYTLTVPTGGGKTLAALRFSLEHARRYQLDRVVFVSPYTSIVEQNAAVARRILEPDGVAFASVVLEHHSNLPFEEAGTTSRGPLVREHWRRKVLAENWDAPVVFTTMVQVLEALFGGGTRPVRRLHALARAVIVFDEAQTLPIRMLHLFNNAVNFLASECGATVLLCTATQPELHTVDQARGAVRLASEPELIDDVPALFASLRRYVVDDQSARAGGWSPDQVAEAACAMASEHGSCLVVLNTRRDARLVFEHSSKRLPQERLVHLSAGMCPAHRMEKLDRLKLLLKAQGEGQAPQPLLCVSTQLIEAGVDIDFAAVIRDLAGLDSVAQAAGRCNRHGERPGGGRVLIVSLPGLPAALVDIIRGRQAAERVLGEWRRSSSGAPFPLDDPAQMKKYFLYLLHERAGEMSYAVKGKDALREDTLLSMLGRNDKAVADAQSEGEPIARMLLRQSFMTAGEAFQVIEPTQGFVVPFGDKGKEIVADLAAAQDLQAQWWLLRRAQPFTISVHSATFQRLQKENAVYQVQGGTGVFCLHSEWYEQEYGLRAEAGLMDSLNV